MKPKLSVRKNEGPKSLYTRAKSKLDGDSLDSLWKLLGEDFNLEEDKNKLLDILSQFFELEFKQ